VARPTLQIEHKASKLLKMEVRLQKSVKSSDFLTRTESADTFEDTIEKNGIEPLLPPSSPVLSRTIMWINEEVAFYLQTIK
jgi:hypothetical protein